MLIIGGGATHRDDEKGEKRRKDTRKIKGREQTMLIIGRFPGILEILSYRVLRILEKGLKAKYYSKKVSVRSDNTFGMQIPDS